MPILLPFTKSSFYFLHFMKKTILYFIVVMLAVACNNNSTENARQDNKHMPKDSTTSKFTLAMVDNTKDFSCGMPLTAGINDTAHYNGKVYGFCSKECKEDFLKNAEAYLKQAK